MCCQPAAHTFAAVDLECLSWLAMEAQLPPACNAMVANHMAACMLCVQYATACW